MPFPLTTPTLFTFPKPTAIRISLHGVWIFHAASALTWRRRPRTVLPIIVLVVHYGISVIELLEAVGGGPVTLAAPVCASFKILVICAGDNADYYKSIWSQRCRAFHVCMYVCMLPVIGLPYLAAALSILCLLVHE